MDDISFERHAEKVLAWIDTALENSGIDLDVETVAGGVLEIEFANASKMVINRHAAAREIWIAARSGGFHFRFVDGGWQDTRSGEGLPAALARLVKEQSGETPDFGNQVASPGV